MKPTITAQNDALTLRVLKTDKFKAGMLSLSAVLPIERDSAYLTSLLFSVLMRGTEKYPSLEAINRRLDYLYGTELTLRNFYRGDLQVIGFSAELLDTAYLPDGDPTADILEVVEQILFHPLRNENGLLLEKYVESEKKLQCDSIRSLKNNPRVYAAEQMRGLLYGGQPCGVPIYGTEEDLMAVTPELLTAHWKRLTESLTLDCFYVGSMDEGALWEHLRSTVGKYTHKKKDEKLPCACAPIPMRETAQTVCEEIDAGQSHLLMAWRSDKTLNSEGHAARIVLNELFGASPVSRLFVHVRERLSLCYSCSSAYASFKGTLRVACGVHRDNREAAEEEIKRQFGVLSDGAFSEDELMAAKKSLQHYLRQIEDSPSAMESFYYSRIVAENPDTVENLSKAIEEVTKEDVVQAAREFSPHTVYFLKGTLNEEECDDDEN
ncbi:MAG: insulinase family protein [Clostridia bacterium]|nr:insulinase family protein [Clostridia bacterium]